MNEYESKDKSNLDEIKLVHGWLLRLRRFERWQEGEYQKLNISQSDIITFLSDKKTNRRLAQWLQFEYDENLKPVEISDEVVNKALDNLNFISLRANSVINLCYSFILFIFEGKTRAAWYSTGKDDASLLNDNIVITYDATENETKEFVKAFGVIINDNPGLNKILDAKGSRLNELVYKVKMLER